MLFAKFNSAFKSHSRLKLFNAAAATGMIAAIGFLSLPVAQAQTVVDATEANAVWVSDSGYPSFWTDNFSTVNDVLLGLTPTAYTGDFTAGNSVTRTSVTDGNLYTVTTDNTLNEPYFEAVGSGAGTELIYALNQPTQLSSIQYYGGWVDNGRSSINFTVSYSMDNGVTYTPLYDPTGGYYYGTGDPPDTQTGGMSGSTPFGTATFARLLGGNSPITNFVDVTDESGVLAGGAEITDLEFTFGASPAGYGWDGLEQLVATAVPEPDSMALLALGGMSLLIRQRRQKKCISGSPELNRSFYRDIRTGPA